MDHLLERNVASELNFGHFTPATYVVATPGSTMLHGHAGAVESLSISDVLAQQFARVDDQNVGAVYADVLSAVESDRRRRALERSRHAYETVLGWIDGNIATTLAIDAISRGTRQSSAALRRLLREHAGMSIASFIRARRISAALVMLASSRKRLSLIAAACGFASQSHFSRSIRAEAGVTPSQYRKRFIDRRVSGLE